ncbi:hypothetical protein F5148DRAFT_916296 [Russula earlei]|uniref:Uncharacterized protein n=1 Tax=Russula earlei TaxID=71964 RepID=A0ACC0UBC0_9AGAM|nr:hypothetical protein F5148DRAFT_916296 [Russula earlei]
MNPMDAQRYDLSKRNPPASEENDANGACGARIANPLVVHDTSSNEALRSPLPTACVALKLLPPNCSRKCDALGVPLSLSPLVSPSSNDFMEDALPPPVTLNKGSFIKFPTTADDDPRSPHIHDHIASSPRISHSFTLPTRPLFHRSESPERIFSRPSSPSPMSPPTRPTSPHFWKSACSSPQAWPERPLNPHYHRFDGFASESMSCPTSPLLRPSIPFPSPTSPSASHANFSAAIRRLRVLSSMSCMSQAISPVPSRPTSPMSGPTSPILQAFNIDNWVPDRDPTEGIDVIEIMVTKEISVRVEEVV